MRLRGPWIIRGAGLDTSVSSQSGSIPPNTYLAVMLSPYSFFPDRLQRKWVNQVDDILRYDLIFPADADAPQLLFYNHPGAAAPYVVEWRHINP